MVDGRIDALDSPSRLKEKFNVDSMDEVFFHLARGAKARS
jgi:ABC-2 type transport system ATP-binding protein